MPHKDPEVRKAYAKAYSARLYREQPERVKERNAAWAAANREAKIAIVRRWQAKNPETMLVASRKQCAKRKAMRLANPDLIRHEDATIRQRYAARHPERVLLKRAANRAREYGIPFDLVESDIVIPSVCPVYGTPFVAEPGKKGRANNTSPSLDRVIPALGYVKGNVRVISNRANNLKNNASLEDLERLVDYLRAVRDGYL